MSTLQRHLHVLLFAAGLGCGIAAGASADDDGGRDHGHPAHDTDAGERDDYDRVLDGVRAGSILPLSRLKAVVLEKWPGELLGVSIDTEHGRISYEFRILRDNGRVTEVELDAADATIVEVENE